MKARSETGTQKFRVNYTAGYKPKLILFFNLFPPPFFLLSFGSVNFDSP